MSKTNYTKVEKALEEGLVKIKSQQLLEEADALKTLEKKDPKIPTKDVCNAVLTYLDRELKKLRKEDGTLYKELIFQKIDIKKLITNPSLLTPQDWKTVKEIKERIDQHKKELSARLPAESDQDIIDHERDRHQNKRFNVSKRWIPLDRIPN